MNILGFINSNAKGGILAESDAFDNPQEAEDTWADPSAITWLSPDALRLGKIKDKPQAQWPQGIESLMQFAIASIRDVTGVNLELLGLVDREQPGILEHQRKQAGMTILAGLFDALRRYQWVVVPSVSWAFLAAGIACPPLPHLEGQDTQTLLYALLGIGGLRTVDKITGNDTVAVGFGKIGQAIKGALGDR